MPEGKAASREQDELRRQRALARGLPKTRLASAPMSERGSRADENVPGEGDVRNGDRAEMHGEAALPKPEVENEAADHADDCCRLWWQSA